MFHLVVSAPLLVHVFDMKHIQMRGSVCNGEFFLRLLHGLYFIKKGGLVEMFALRKLTPDIRVQRWVLKVESQIMSAWHCMRRLISISIFLNRHLTKGELSFSGKDRKVTL